MYDQDESHPEDRLAVGKGIAFGILFGSVLWAGIIFCLWFWLMR